MIDAISFNDKTLRYLDQRYLPLREEYVSTRSHQEAIKIEPRVIKTTTIIM